MAQQHENDFHNVELNESKSDNKSVTIPTITGTIPFEHPSLKQQPPEEEEDPTTVQYDYEEILQLIGFGKTQWIILLMSGLMLMMVINETMGMSIINIASQCDFATSSTDKAIMSGSSFIGILCSSYFWGYLSDTIGRQRVLVLSTFGGNFFSLISMFVPNFWIFVFVRFLVGIFIAGPSSTTYAYLGEFYIERHRPVVTNYAGMFVAIAMTYFPAVAWLMLMMDWSLPISDTFSFRPWRLLFITNLLPGFAAALVMSLFLPESPKLYMSLQMEEKAYEAINWICRRNTGRDLSDLKIFKLKMPPKLMDQENILNTTTSLSSVAILKKMWQSTKPLFKRPHVGNFIISCITVFGFFMSSTGMGLWYPEIQNRVSAEANENALTVCQVIDASMERKANISEQQNELCVDTISSKSFIDSITFGLFYIVGYIILGIIINPIGRKKLMIGALCLSGICGIALYWILNPIAMVASFCLFLILPGLCISVLSGALVDLVPTHLRGKAVCICLMLGRSGGVIGSNIIGILLESYCTITFGLFSASAFVCAALIFILPI